MRIKNAILDMCSVGTRLSLVYALLMVATGCAQRHRAYTPEVDPATLNDVVFMHYLARTPVVTVDEGQRAVLLLVGSTDEWPTPQARAAELTRRGAMKDSWNLNPEQLLDHGTLAHMLRVICNLPSGINDLMGEWFGIGDRRAALRTCTYEGLLPHNVPDQPVTGGDLQSALVRAESCLDPPRTLVEP